MASEAGRFFDTRAAYTMFVNATDEKSVVADRIASQAAAIEVGQPGLRVFDAGMGDGSLITNLMRHLHDRLPFIPWLIVAKEISIEDVRQGLARLPDRFLEHPEMVFVVTNLHFREAARLVAGTGTRWREVALTGSTTHDFTAQIESLYPTLADDWQVTTSRVTGNPLYVHPAVLILYRSDHRFVLDPLIPRPGTLGPYDLMIASQAYRARTPVERKVNMVLAPMARALSPGGRLIAVQGRGDDPGLEIIQAVWPGEQPFPYQRSQILAEARRQLAAESDLCFPSLEDDESIFRFHLHTMPSDEAEHIGTSSVVAAWNAATYVAQIDDSRLAAATAAGTYLNATRSVMQRHGRIWWNNEMFLIERARVSKT
ncbi:MAG: hypothetical protein ACT4OP_13105 [Actinomycetota bacterium]